MKLLNYKINSCIVIFVQFYIMLFNNLIDNCFIFSYKANNNNKNKLLVFKTDNKIKNKVIKENFFSSNIKNINYNDNNNLIKITKYKESKNLMTQPSYISSVISPVLVPIVKSNNLNISNLISNVNDKLVTNKNNNMNKQHYNPDLNVIKNITNKISSINFENNILSNINNKENIYRIDNILDKNVGKIDTSLKNIDLNFKNKEKESILTKDIPQNKQDLLQESYKHTISNSNIINQNITVKKIRQDINKIEGLYRLGKFDESIKLIINLIVNIEKSGYSDNKVNTWYNRISNIILDTNKQVSLFLLKKIKLKSNKLNNMLSNITNLTHNKKQYSKEINIKNKENNKNVKKLKTKK